MMIISLTRGDHASNQVFWINCESIESLQGWAEAEGCKIRTTSGQEFKVEESAGDVLSLMAEAEILEAGLDPDEILREADDHH